MVDTSIFEPGQRCGPYTIQRLLERGVPELYLAVPATNGKGKTENPMAPVHIQCADIRRTGPATPPEAQWSATLAKLSALRHPFVPRVLDAGIHEGHIRWIASEHTPGGPFKVFGKRPAERVLREIFAFGVLVANAMAFAGAAGLFHGNLSFRSILVTEPGEGVNASIRVIGLGSVELFGLPPDIARGSPLFRAPEQLRGEPVDARSDIYSLGMILYALIARRPPFWGAGDAPPSDLLALAMNETPPPLAEVAGCSELISNTFELAVDKRPNQRFPDWRYFGIALSTLFRHAHADAASRSRDEKEKAARERGKDAETYYVEAHPERDGVESGFRARDLADLVAQGGEIDQRVTENSPSAPRESPPPSPPPSTQKSGIEPQETQQPSLPGPTSKPLAPTLPPSPERRDPRLSRPLVYSLTLLLAGIGLGGVAGVMLAARFRNARAEIAAQSLGLAALPSLGVPDPARDLADSPRDVRSPEPQEPVLSAQPSTTSEPVLRPSAPGTSRQPVEPFPMDQWEPSRRTLVPTGPTVANK